MILFQCLYMLQFPLVASRWLMGCSAWMNEGDVFFFHFSSKNMRLWIVTGP